MGPIPKRELGQCGIVDRAKLALKSQHTGVGWPVLFMSKET